MYMGFVDFTKALIKLILLIAIGLFTVLSGIEFKLEAIFDIVFNLIW